MNSFFYDVFFYTKIAYTNLVKNSKIYIPFSIASMGIIIMFYNVCYIRFHSFTVTANPSVISMLTVGAVVTGVFAVIFLFYTNSFLVKRRKKEFGLYNVLGMEKKHISKIIVCENFLIAIASIIIGLILGISFSKLFALAFYKLLTFMPNYSFEISIQALKYTITLFIIIFALIALNSIRIVYSTRIIKMLKGGNIGEKMPKTNWITTILGFITLGGGYYIALSIVDPRYALTSFFAAVILVMIGTYLLFISVTITILKILQRNKKLYYKTRYFTAISGMLYRMKQNAVGLANICLMCTAVIVMISTTAAMYMGIMDILNYRYPSDVTLSSNYTLEEKGEYNNISSKIEDKLKTDNVEYSNFREYSAFPFEVSGSGNEYTMIPPSYSFEGKTMVTLTTDEYAKLTGKDKPNLSDDEVLLYASDETLSNNHISDTIFIDENKYDIKAIDDSISGIGQNRLFMAEVIYLVVSENTSNDFYNRAVSGEMTNSFEYKVNFDFETSDEVAKDYAINELIPFWQNDLVKESSKKYEIKQLTAKSFYELYSAFLFLGIFLGFLFSMATVLIIYYKQVVEGISDREQFTIMQKVGMSKKEIKDSINAQVLMVFALPIIVAIIHMAFAFPVLTLILKILNFTNVALFFRSTCMTVLVFIALYVLVYHITSKVYFKIVK